MIEKTDYTVSSPQQQSSPLGHFAVGFSVGLVAGAVGYYLFGTQDGKKITQFLKEEWEDLHKLSKDGEDTAFSPPGWWVDIKKAIKEVAGEEPAVKKTAPVKPKTTAPVKRVTRAPKKNTFKGI